MGIDDQAMLMSELLDKKLNGHVLAIENKHPALTVSGWVSDPTVTFSNRNKQIISVNHRVVASGYSKNYS